jgi:hypothetical protein
MPAATVPPSTTKTKDGGKGNERGLSVTGVIHPAIARATQQSQSESMSQKSKR